ncbi:glycosyltransferase [Hymenobacter weizhouensis]|uniref:glycosyltransferase n=1 Tax=Hymenobacter sp. YIM 151500-1 TaxID=2987689 RepID=UPI002225BB33|nr:glycosyltransferase [Hymenobacter sp. YIM 151500-1]UYZ61370.1 glycosyltransferase [Hymenobacter sp. YIM 151500-1]
MPPKVSVIIPNYNHARYLPQRIESVLSQTLRDMEVLLLDDCSLDNSRDIIAHYAAQDARIRVVLNEHNSGSTFKQWNKGIALAQGEYVWLAESDDYADPKLLATLAVHLDALPAAGLAYCDSYSVDEHNKLMPIATWEPFLAELDPALWKQDFVRPGIELVRRFMSYRNIIPNASAVLLRRATLQQVGPANENFKVLGDWLFWARILAAGEVVFVAQPLNYFRTHRNNVRSKTLENGTALLETTQMLAAMRQYGPPEAHFYQKSIELLLAVWFHSLVYYKVPVQTHRAIYRNMVALDPEFARQFKKAFWHFLLGNKLSGIRMLIGDKLLYPLRNRLSS